AGVGHYLFGLVGELAGRPDDVELHVAAKARDLEERRRHAPGAVLHRVPADARLSRILWEQTGLPGLARKVAPHVVHGPHYTLPLWNRSRSVVTFHDPTFFTAPELHQRYKVAYFTSMARLSARRAARVITVSRYGERGAVEYAGARPDRTDVVPLGVDHDRYRPEPEGDGD